MALVRPDAADAAAERVARELARDDGSACCEAVRVKPATFFVDHVEAEAILIDDAIDAAIRGGLRDDATLRARP